MNGLTGDRADRRDGLLSQIPNRTFDIIVIGGGINGTGIARDAAMRGLRVLLLEQGDLGEGTTAWSTRLIHGGLRYLEHAEIPLVRESLREREILFRNAPHLVQPLPFLVPVYRGNKRGPWLIRLGMIAYDLLSIDKSVDNHRMLGPDAVAVRAPGITRDGLRAAAMYYDGQVTFPERIAVENALSAGDHGATVLTHARVDQLLISGNRATGVRFTDLLGAERREYTASAPLTINVAGPWVDQLTGVTDGTRLIGGTKGSHIVVERFPGAPDCAIYAENETDRRPYFIVPWNGHFLIGTTDSRYEGDLNDLRATESEIAYLLRDTNRLFPDAKLTRADVRYSYAGVRPLPHVPEGAEAGITRRHIVHDHAPEIEGLISIVGGKLTTYRNLAEQSVDLALRKLGRRQVPTATSEIPLPGGNTRDFTAFVTRFRQQFSLDEETADRLLRIYGVQAGPLLERSRRDNSLLEPIPDVPGTIQGEIPYAFHIEGALTLTDALMRRTMLGLNPGHVLSSIEQIADLAAEHNGWDAARRDREIDAYRAWLERFQPQQLSSGF